MPDPAVTIVVRLKDEATGTPMAQLQQRIADQTRSFGERAGTISTISRPGEAGAAGMAGEDEAALRERWAARTKEIAKYGSAQQSTEQSTLSFVRATAILHTTLEVVKGVVDGVTAAFADMNRTGMTPLEGKFEMATGAAEGFLQTIEKIPIAGKGFELLNKGVGAFANELWSKGGPLGAIFGEGYDAAGQQKAQASANKQAETRAQFMAGFDEEIKARENAQALAAAARSDDAGALIAARAQIEAQKQLADLETKQAEISEAWGKKEINRATFRELTAKADERRKQIGLDLTDQLALADEKRAEAAKKAEAERAAAAAAAAAAEEKRIRTAIAGISSLTAAYKKQAADIGKTPLELELDKVNEAERAAKAAVSKVAAGPYGLADWRKRQGEIEAEAEKARTAARLVDQRRQEEAYTKQAGDFQAKIAKDIKQLQIDSIEDVNERRRELLRQQYAEEMAQAWAFGQQAVMLVQQKFALLAAQIKEKTAEVAQAAEAPAVRALMPDRRGITPFESRFSGGGRDPSLVAAADTAKNTAETVRLQKAQNAILQEMRDRGTNTIDFRIN